MFTNNHEHLSMQKFQLQKDVSNLSSQTSSRAEHVFTFIAELNLERLEPNLKTCFELNLVSFNPFSKITFSKISQENNLHLCNISIRISTEDNSFIRYISNRNIILM